MITTTVTADEFVKWLQNSDNYKNSFSIDGAYALFEYLDNLSDELGEYFEFDPIAWCCEFTEYENLKEVQGDYWDIKSLNELKDNTVVIEFDGGLIIQSY